MKNLFSSSYRYISVRTMRVSSFYSTGRADQIRRSSRSVCSNISEAWRKRRYKAAFICKLNDSESEASETQTWIQFSVKCGYISKKVGTDLFQVYDQIIGKLVHPVKYFHL